MTADLLRRAAPELRDIANACEPGPWMFEAYPSGSVWINTPMSTHAWGMTGFINEARYVSLMHPPVALALADLLQTLSWMPTFTVDATDMQAATILARAVLREDTR